MTNFIAPALCEVVHAATDDIALTENNYRMKVVNAVTHLIGVPTKTIMRASKAAYEKSPTKSNKKRYDAETRRFIEHEKLRDEFVEYTMETGKEANYNTHLADPTEIADSWRAIFARRLQGEITPRTILHGERKVRAVRRLVKRIKNKRETLLKKGKIGKTALFLSPPEFVVSHFDKFGFIGGLVEKILTMSDRNIQESSRFFDPMSKSRDDLTKELTNQLNSDAASFNVKTSAMNGITGFRTNLGEEVTIHSKETNDLGEVFWVITKNDDESGIRYNLPDDMSASEHLETDVQGVEDRLVRQYTDELMNELGDGQTRYVVPKLLEEASDEDMAAIRGILDQAYLEKKRESGDRVPGLQTIIKKVTDEVTNIEEDWEYTFIMVKQGEGSNKGERYNTYLVNKKKQIVSASGEKSYSSTTNFIGKTRTVDGETISETQYNYDQSELDDILNEGFYKSETNENFGKHTYKTKDKVTLADGTEQDVDVEEPMYTEQEVRGSQKKNWVLFERMENQPDEGAMKKVWEAMAVHRKQYESVFNDLQEKNRRIEAKRQKLHQNIINWRVKAMGDSHEDASVWLSDKLKTLGVNEYIRLNDNGQIITSTTFATKKKQNYWPNMYHRENIFAVQIPAAIAEIQEKIQNFGVTKQQLEEVGEYEGSRLEELYIGFEHLHKMIKDYNQSLEVDMGSLNDLNALKNLKHITSWTNPEMRRKDGGIHHDYFSQSYNTIHKNDIMIELMNAIYKMTRVDKNLPEGSIDYVINRVKIGFGDPSSRAITITGKETSYDKMAEKLNGLPEWVFGGIIHNGKSAEKLTKWLTAPASMTYLGGSSALGNSAQIMNQIMRVGWKTGAEAYADYNSRNEDWKEIVRNTGILNVLSMFQDVMLKDGKTSWNDAGIVNVAGVPIPTLNMVKFGRLLKAGRKSFVENGTDEIDAFLFKLLRSAEGETRDKIQRLININELRQGIKNKDLREKRGRLYDIFTMDEETSKATVEKAFRELVGEVADRKLKQMVSWKLSWWFDEAGGPGKDLFTFTGSEERLRSLTVVMALKHASKTGLLGDVHDGNWKEVFKTPMAVRIARNAVYYTQFGMTPPYLGEGFNGAGRALWQYKQYPTLQMIHDGQLWMSFMDGNYGMADGFFRIAKAVSGQTVNFWKKGRSYDPSDRNIDHEAIMMARWISTRGIASVLASTIGIIPFLGTGIRAIAPNLPIYSLFRGAENPALGLITRSLLWGSLFLMGADEEDERNDLTNSFGYFFTPVLLGMMIRGVMSSYEYLED